MLLSGCLGSGFSVARSYLGATVDCLPTSTSVACSPTHPRPSVIGCRFHAPRQATSTVQAPDSLTELLLVLQKLLDTFGQLEEYDAHIVSRLETLLICCTMKPATQGSVQ